MNKADNPAQYLESIKAVARIVVNPAEGYNLAQYVLNTIPYMDKGEEHFERFLALDNVCQFWMQKGTYEDGMAVAFDILYALCMYGHSDPLDVDAMLAINTLHTSFINDPDAAWEDFLDYTEFCDKYANELN